VDVSGAGLQAGPLFVFAGGEQFDLSRDLDKMGFAHGQHMAGAHEVYPGMVE
jgi:hypothetical protein